MPRQAKKSGPEGQIARMVTKQVTTGKRFSLFTMERSEWPDF